MKSTTFKETNAIYYAGDNPNTDQLAVCKALDPNLKDVPHIISKFKLDENDMVKIKETGEVWIIIMGSGMPPICPTVFNPFDDFGFKPM